MLADAKRVQAVFLASVDIADAAQRAAYLDRECGADADLRQRVEALLQSHDSPASILSRPVIPMEAQESSSHTLPLDASSDQAGSFAGNQTQDQATMDAHPNQDQDPSALDLLEPSAKPGSLGRLGHYEVLEVLGEGGFGTVVKAYDEKLQRTIAIKIMAPRLAATSPARKRFMREARSSAAIRHENVVDIHAIEEQPIPFLVMEYVPGETLQQRLDRVGPLETLAVLRIGVQIARGLAAAHAMGRIHRDIKPANILLENGVDRVKITDFGLARAADDASLTQSGFIAGTPMYMAPEQAQGVAVDQRADLFSLGSVLYVMCSGRPPFRASTTLAVLKRVADDTPRPIREIIPEVPEWLCDIITKLHAKKPGDRFQTAQEVADMLGNYLSELQLHGKVQSVIPTTPKIAAAPVAGNSNLQIADCKLESDSRQSAICNLQSAIRRRRLAIAAAVLLCLAGGLSLTEATGVTNLRGTVIRIFTPDGTLVVDINDPGVKVTIEGDGGLVITGAGLEEIRLRPGAYKVFADRDGKPVPLERELVSIATRGREVVKVKVEAAPAPVAAKGEKSAFVLLVAGKERKFDTLVEAVKAAGAGDTIEVRGNGPFITQPISLDRKGLTIRAATGFRPIVQGMADRAAGVPWLHTRGPLVLEGLDLRVTSSLLSEQAPLHVANCRIVLDGPGFPINAHSPLLTVRNCQFARTANSDCEHILASLSDEHAIVLENNVFADPFGRALGLLWESADLQNVTVRLNHNTMVTGISFVHGFKDVPESAGPGAGPDRQPVQIHVSANLFDPIDTTGGTCFFLLPPDLFHADAKPLSAEEVGRLLPRLIAWREERNLYRKGMTLLTMSRITDRSKPDRGEVIDVLPAGRALADWQRLWKTGDSGSAEGVIRYEGGDVLTRLRTTPDRVTPADFRLRPDSAGYQAGKGKKDLGADVDLVGPGLAYERWKKTPEYQQWLKDTAPVRAKVPEPKPEPGAFVRLGGKGVAERKFDTLAEAVLAATDGDTIEVRGNGPFVTGPINLGRTALTIRAGAGFRPVIKSSRTGDQKSGALLQTDARLTVEGLELQRTGSEPPKDGDYWVIIYSSRGSGSLQAANCRFVGTQITHHVGSESAYCELRNCEFLGHVFWAVVWDPPPDSRLVISNCLLTRHVVVGNVTMDDRKPASIRLTDTTSVGSGLMEVNMGMERWRHALKRDGAGKVLRMEAAGNVIVGGSVLGPYVDDNAVPADEVEAIFSKGFGWKGERNLFNLSGLFLYLSTSGKALTPAKPLKDLADWKQFWGSAESGSVTGQVRFQRSNLLGKIAAAPEAVTPDDFRLRATSAGYRAGRDGKDLGADVDLVGPGAAYERWKKTPEYQQWLKETGQLKK